MRMVLGNLLLLCSGCHNWIHSKDNLENKFIGGEYDDWRRIVR